MTNSSGLAAYLARMDEIPGGLDRPDAYVFKAISDLQIESGIAGDILEIGTYQGRSAIVLGYLLGEQEALHICEPFPEISADNPDFLPHTIDWYASFSQQTFEEHYLRFHDELPEIHAHQSIDLHGKLAPNTFRLVHLDGSHTPDALESDISLTRSILVDEGVVSFDVYRSMHTLEVAAAVWSEVASATLFPFCATETHIYASVTPYRSDQTDDFHARLRTVPGVSVVPSPFRGVDVALIQRRPGASKTTLKSFVPPILLPPARRARSWARRVRGR